MIDIGHDLNDKNLDDDEEMISKCGFLLDHDWTDLVANSNLCPSPTILLSVAVDINEVPTKCISFTGNITVEAQVQFIDFEGRSDGESIQKIITSMKPRRLILVRGSEESTQAIFAHAQQYTDAKVYAPRCGDTIDVTMETHIYQVRLTDALLSALEFKMGKDAEVAWLCGRIAAKEKKRETKIEDMDKTTPNTTTEEKMGTLGNVLVAMVG